MEAGKNICSFYFHVVRFHFSRETSGSDGVKKLQSNLQEINMLSACVLLRNYLIKALLLAQHGTATVDHVTI